MRSRAQPSIRRPEDWFLGRVLSGCAGQRFDDELLSAALDMYPNLFSVSPVGSRGSSLPWERLPCSWLGEDKGTIVHEWSELLAKTPGTQLCACARRCGAAPCTSWEKAWRAGLHCFCRPGVRLGDGCVGQPSSMVVLKGNKKCPGWRRYGFVCMSSQEPVRLGCFL